MREVTRLWMRIAAVRFSSKCAHEPTIIKNKLIL